MYKSKIGIIGGTFNPIHNGHIKLSLNIINHFSLSKVMFLPNNIPPHKDVSTIVNKEDRFVMIERGIDGYSNLEIERFEIERDKISYTYESLEYLKKVYKESELFFITGSDGFLNFDKWRYIDRIFKASNLIVYLRDTSHKDRVIKLKEKYQKLYGGKIFLYLGDVIEISSTKIRGDIISGNDVSELIPKSVYEYILSKNLYRG